MAHYGCKYYPFLAAYTDDGNVRLVLRDFLHVVSADHNALSDAFGPVQETVKRWGARPVCAITDETSISPRAVVERLVLLGDMWNAHGYACARDVRHEIREFDGVIDHLKAVAD
jgi:hypothetical protein